MMKDDAGKRYTVMERMFKEKVLIYMNYVLGAVSLLEGLKGYYVSNIYIYIYI